MKILRFETLYKSHISPLTRFVFKKIGSDPYQAEIIVSETFEAAWKGYKTFKHKSSFFTWLCRIALNKLADYYKDQINNRSKLVFPTLKKLAQIESKDIAIDEKIALDELKESVNNVLNLLPDDKRKLLQFKYYKDLSNKEISIILNITTKAVEGRLRRARWTFKKIYNNAISPQYHR